MLLVKKIVFLLIALDKSYDLKDFSEVKALYKQFKEKKLVLPKSPILGELMKLAMHLTYMIETPSERHAVCIPYIIDKLYEVEKLSKKPGFGTLMGGVRYVSMSPAADHSGGKKKQESLGAIRRPKVSRPSKPDRSSNLNSKSNAFEDEDEEQVFSGVDEDYDDISSKNDFACVPVNNIDNVHIKIMEDEDFPRPGSANMDENHGSVAARCLRVLVEGQGVTVKSNKNVVMTDDNGILDVNQIKLRMSGQNYHKKTLSI